MKKIWMLLPVLMVLAGCATGMSIWDKATVQSVRIVDYGIYDKVDDAALSRLLVQTTTIPAKIGTSFGFRYVTEGLPRGAVARLTYQDSYPGLQNPKGGEPLKDVEYSNEVEVGTADICAFTFEEEWELVPGEWTFSIGRNGKLLAEQTFTVQ